MNKSTRKGNKRPSSWFSISLIVLAGIGLSIGTTYIWQHSQLVVTQQELHAANSKINVLEAQERLASLPSRSDFSPQCDNVDNRNLIFAPLTLSPINGYEVYKIQCVNDESSTINIAMFKIDNDGSRIFAYRSSSLEPYCISSNVIDAEVANEIYHQTAVPLCKTY